VMVAVDRRSHAKRPLSDLERTRLAGAERLTGDE
jgi:hypothetical protein